MPQPRGGRYIAGLDGVRAIAAIAVLLYHVSVFVRPARSVARVAGVGWVGVDIFFAISGFILFLPFARGHLEGRRMDLRAYARGRARRILPAYWLNVLVLVALVVPAAVLSPRWWAMVATNATFTAKYVSLPSVNGVYWTLYCEVVFYAVLPLMARAFVGRRWLVALPVTLLVGSVIRFALVHRYGSPVEHAPLERMLESFPAVIDQFAAGMGAAGLWALMERRPVRVPAVALHALAAAGLALMIGVLYEIQVGIGPTAYWASSSRWGIGPLVVFRPLLSVGAALVILGVCFRPTGLTRALEVRPVRYLGLVSYGVYLWHLPIVEHIAESVPATAHPNVVYATVVVIVLLGSLALAAVSFHFVEQRFIVRRRNGLAAEPAPVGRDVPLAADRLDVVPSRTS